MKTSNFGALESVGNANVPQVCRIPPETTRRAVWGSGLAVLGFMLLLAVLPASSAATCRQGMDSEGTDVSGKVSVRGDGVLPVIYVQLQPAIGGLMQFTETDPFGSFLFTHVARGSYWIVITAEGYQPVDWPLEVGTAPIVGLSIILTPDGSSDPRGVPPNGSAAVSVRQLLIPPQAREEYDKALESAARGKTDDAIEHWKKSIRIFPSYAESYMQLSKVYANRGDFVHATRAAKRAIDIDDKSADPYEFLGYVYLKEKDFPKAKEALAHAVRLSDSHWLCQFWLGKLLLDEKDAQGAFPHLLRASQLNPRIPEIEIALYDDLLMLGRPRDALAKLDDFLARFPNSPLAAKAREQRNRLAKSLGERQP